MLQQHHLAAPVAPPGELQAPAAHAAGRQAGRRGPAWGRQAGAQVAARQQRASGRPSASEPAAGGVPQLSQGDGSGGSPEHGASHLADGESSGQGPRQSHSAGGESSSSLAAPPGPTKQGLSALQALLADAEATRSGRTSPAPASSGEVQDSGHSLAAPQAEQAGVLGGTPGLASTPAAEAERSVSLTDSLTPAAAQAEHAGLLSGRSGRDTPAAAMTERYELLGNTSGLESPAADSSSSWQPGTDSEALHAALTAAADGAATAPAGSSASAATPDVGGHLLSQHPLQALEPQGAALGLRQQAGTQPHSLRRRPVTGQSSVPGWLLIPDTANSAILHAELCSTLGCTLLLPLNSLAAHVCRIPACTAARHPVARLAAAFVLACGTQPDTCWQLSGKSAACIPACKPARVLQAWRREQDSRRRPQAGRARPAGRAACPRMGLCTLKSASGRRWLRLSMPGGGRRHLPPMSWSSRAPYAFSWPQQPQLGQPHCLASASIAPTGLWHCLGQP